MAVPSPLLINDKCTHAYEVTCVLTRMHSTGPNISSFQHLLERGTSVRIVGGIKNPTLDLDPVPVVPSPTIPDPTVLVGDILCADEGN